MKTAIHIGTVRNDAVQDRLATTLARHMAAANLVGRLQVLRHARGKTRRALPLAMGSQPLRFDEQDDPDTPAVVLTGLRPGEAGAGFAFDVGGDDAAAYVRNLTPVTREIFDGLTAQYRRDAFTLSGAADLRLIQKVQEALAQTLQKGATPAEFRAAADQLATEAGVEKLNAFTLDTAFQIAMQKAHSAGRLEQMREPHMVDALPFWQYWTVGDLRVRPAHAALDGFVARALDPVWLKIYPPWDFGCRCSAVPLPEDEALAADPDGSEGGLERLPILARIAAATTAQRGFHTLIHP